MSSAAKEPLNPFYLLLLAVSGLFVLTALASTVLLFADRNSLAADSMSAEFQEALRKNGYLWLLGQAAALFVLGALSMGLDRLRRLQKDRGRDNRRALSSQRSAISHPGSNHRPD